MNDNFALRSGKYAGKTIAWLKVNQAGYLAWVKENQPNMLNGSEDKPKIETKPIAVEVTKSLVPNMNFWNEGPDPMSLPYLQKIEQEKTIKNG